jgi:hypothetical protein
MTASKDRGWISDPFSKYLGWGVQPEGPKKTGDGNPDLSKSFQRPEGSKTTGDGIPNPFSVSGLPVSASRHAGQVGKWRQVVMWGQVEASGHVVASGGKWSCGGKWRQVAI